MSVNAPRSLRQRPRVARRPTRPTLELVVLGHGLAPTRTQPRIALPRITNGSTCGISSSALGVLVLAPHQQPAATRHRHGDVAADQERESAEHPLLHNVGLEHQQLAHAVREFLVVGHARIMRRRRASAGASATRSRRSSAPAPRKAICNAVCDPPVCSRAASRATALSPCSSASSSISGAAEQRRVARVGGKWGRCPERM